MESFILKLKKTVVTLAIVLAATAGASAQLTWSGTQTLTAGQVITQNITLTGDVTINLASGIAEIKGVISGNFAVTKTGAGSLGLTGANTYKGLTTISEGTIVLVDPAGSIAGNIAVASGAVLNFNRSNDYLYSGVISGAGNVGKEGTGKVILTGINTYTGSTNVASGTLQIGNGDGTSGSINQTSGVTLSNPTVILRFEPGRANVIFDRIISGSGKVEYKAVAGTAFVLALTADNPYTGTTTIEQGLLSLGNATTTGSVAGDIINNGTLYFSHSNDFIFSKIISGTGDVNVLGNAKVILTGANIYSGATTVSVGATLQIGDGTSGSIANTSGVTLSNPTSILRFEPGADMTFDKVISGSGKVEYKGTGTKRLIFTADNTYTGTTTIESGGYFYLGSSAAGSVAGDIINNGSLVFNRTTDYVYTGVISGAGVVDKYSTNKLTLTGANTYTGQTYIGSGILQIGNGTSGSIANTSDVSVMGTSSTLQVMGNMSISGSLTLNGGAIAMDLTKTPSPKLTVGGAVSPIGTTTLKITGNTAVTNYVLLEATGGGITSTTPYVLDMGSSGLAGALSVQSPTKLLLTAATITNAATPTISNQPQNATVNVGGSATLSVTASVSDGGALSYQWYSNTTNSNSGGTLVTGATAINYSPSTATAGTYYYYVVVTNTNNSVTGNKTATATSAVAKVVVNALTNAATPTISNHPQNATVNVGGSATLSVTASVSDGGALSYQWYSNTTNSNSGGTLVTGATATNYSPSTATAGTYYYYVVVTNTNNSVTGNKTATATSAVAKVVVNALTNAATPTISNHPQNATVNVGGSATLSVTASVSDGGALSYQWYSNTTNSNSGGTLVSGATATNYSPSTATAGTYYYYVVVTNTNNSVTGNKTATATSAVAKVVVNTLTNAATPTISNQPQNATVNVGGSATLSVTASVSDGGALSYQWYSNTTNSNSGGTLVTGATATNYSPSTATAGTYYYYVVVTNTNNSVTGNKTATATSAVAKVVVNALVNAATPTISAQPQSVTVNEGEAATLSVTASVSDGGALSYQWYNNDTGMPISGATGSGFSPPTMTAGVYSYYVVVTNTNTGATGNKTATTTSVAATVTVKKATGIENVSKADPLKAWIENGTLHVSGLTAGKLWSVYNIAGCLIYQGIASGDEATQRLASRGVYIVQSENRTMKILNN